MISRKSAWIQALKHYFESSKGWTLRVNKSGKKTLEKTRKTKGKIQILKPKYIGDTVGLKPLWDDGEQWEDKRNFFVKIDQKRLLQPIYKKAQNGPKNSRFINWNTKI